MKTSFFRGDLIVLITLLLIPPSLLLSQEPDNTNPVLPFEQIWQKTQSSSPALKEAALKKQAAQISSDRSGRHWMPQAYAEYRYFITNDPGTVLFSNMGQRAVTSEDFNPSSLNNPDTTRAGKGSVGVNLPLYEGGAKSAQHEALANKSQARIFAEQFMRRFEFGSAASSYGLLSSLQLKRERLNALKVRVQNLLAGYRSDLKSNPVEYSGILGLKALNNRLKALIDENESRIVSERFYLNRITGNEIPENWNPEQRDILSFSEQYLPASEQKTADDSFRVKEYSADAESARKNADAQKAVFLPNAGVFSQADFYNGERGNENSYTAGFYVSMNLFSPTEYGSVEEARKESEAARYKVESARIQEQVEREKLQNMRQTLKSNIAILRDSLVIINEQTANSFRLFSNGSMKAFQLVEVLSRKTDLIINLSEAEEGYLSASSGLYILSTNGSEALNENR